MRVLRPHHHDDRLDAFDRQLLGVWLNVATGAVDVEDRFWGRTVGDLLAAAETARLDRDATRHELAQYRHALEAVSARR
ncbi:hypothetical protein ACIG47_19070 [Promicromonospora sp. NPDC052451]|uniref:hypothetical protein n=1 Tax=Promicromonospora sp. NPDC052451 TaxID=3364407 RepID=UPI0037C8B738